MSCIGACILATISLLIETSSAQLLALTLNQSTISEGMAVEVCLTLIGGTPNSTATATLRTRDIQTTADRDYIALNEEFTFSSTATVDQCRSLVTLADRAVEDVEALDIMLVDNVNISVGPPVRLSITPVDESIEVEFFTTNITVSEPALQVTNLCVRLVRGSIESQHRNVEVDLRTVEATATTPEDYTQPNSVVFTNGDRESAVKCSLVNVIDDKIVEERESFLIEIVNDSSTQPGAITFGMPSNISIIDNDVAMVAFTNSSVAVVEGGSVCVCVQLSLAPASSLARDVVVKFTNQDVTTESSDYSLPEQLTFLPNTQSGNLRCIPLVTIPDRVEEEDEVVMFQIAPVLPDITLVGAVTSVRLTILNDDTNCPMLTSPNFARVDISSLFEGATANYSCMKGYTLEGNATRTCISGVWSGMEPICTAVVCGMPPNLTDGTVKVNGTTYRSVANYSCQPGYQQTGQINTAICQANGNWSDVGIQCVQDDAYDDDSSSDALSEGAVAGIVISLLFCVAIVVAVLVIVILACTPRKKIKRPRSGKYSLKNKDIELPTNGPKASEDNNFNREPSFNLGHSISSSMNYEGDYRSSIASYPTDV